MQLVQFLAAWLFPAGAVCFAVDDMAAAAYSSELDRASSSSPPSFSGGNAAGSAGSSLSSPSSSSSDSVSFKSRYRRQMSPSATPLCFGTGRRLLRGRGSGTRAPAKQPQEEQEEEEEAAATATMAPKVKQGDVVGRYLRMVSRRLRKARSESDGKLGSTSSPMAASAAVDDTARERAESVANAISYCKDTSPSRSPTPPPPPSPSLDEWLHDRQEEIVASAAAVAHGEASKRHGHGCHGGESVSSLDEMEFLKAFDGDDEEMISHHFITVDI